MEQIIPKTLETHLPTSNLVFKDFFDCDFTVVLEEMLKLQANNNTIQHHDSWFTLDADSRPDHRAAYLEICEGLEHIGWNQWWKKAPVVTDSAYKQYVIELVDAMHFILSECIRDTYQDIKDDLDDEDELSTISLESIIDSTLTDIVPDIEHYRDSIIFMVDKPDPNMLYRALDSLVARTSNLSEVASNKLGDLFVCMSLSGYTLSSIYKLYLGKNVLNGLRSTNGYKTGEYVKDWTFLNPNFVEDNVCLENYLDSFEGTVPTFEQIDEHMRSAYLLVKANSER